MRKLVCKKMGEQEEDYLIRYYAGTFALLCFYILDDGGVYSAVFIGQYFFGKTGPFNLKLGHSLYFCLLLYPLN